MGISHGKDFLSSTHMYIFLCTVLCKLLHEKIYLEDVQFIYFFTFHLKSKVL